MFLAILVWTKRTKSGRNGQVKTQGALTVPKISSGASALNTETTGRAVAIAEKKKTPLP